MPRRAMSSVKEVSSDSDCSTRSTRGATKVPEPCRCTRMPPLHQILHGLAHGDARHVGLDRDVALGRQRIARPDDAAADRVLDRSASAADRAARRLLADAFRAAKMSFGGVSHCRPPPSDANSRTAIGTAPPSASCSGGRSSAR